MSASTRLYLIGGSAGTGKTTVAPQLAARLGAGWLQADTVWIALRAALPAESPDRQSLEIDQAIRAGEASDGALLAHHIRAAEIVCGALGPAIEFELMEAHEALVVDGAWLIPSWVAGLQFNHVDATVRSVFIQEDEAHEVKRAMDSRRAASSTMPWHARSARLSWAYGQWLSDESRRLALPVVPARPRDGLLARVLEALTG